MEKAFVDSVFGIQEMPDIAKDTEASVQGCIDRVGMTSVEIPVQIPQEDGSLLQCAAWADAFVSLDNPEAKGIHMSRLYLSLVENLEANPLSFSLLKKTALSFVESHRGLSRRAFLKLKFDYLTHRKALLSGNLGWRSYPMWMEVILDSELEATFHMGVQVTYSSTCPCSAALARQLIRKKFQKDYGDREQLSKEEVADWILKEESICATPHSQRSYADVEITLAKGVTEYPTLLEFIDRVEAAVETVVQAAVKREDEQEFARLNGKNLMFCEDAARKLKKSIEADPRIVGYRIQTKHMESLHPHNAVSILEKLAPV